MRSWSVTAVAVAGLIVGGLAAARADDEVRVVPRPVGLHDTRVVALAHPSGDRVVTADADGRVRTFDTATGAILSTVEMPEAIRRCTHLVPSPDAALIAGLRPESAGRMESGRTSLRIARLTDGSVVSDTTLGGERALALRWTQDGDVAALTDAGLVTISPGDGTEISRVAWPEIGPPLADVLLGALLFGSNTDLSARIAPDGSAFCVVSGTLDDRTPPLMHIVSRTGQRELEVGRSAVEFLPRSPLRALAYGRNGVVVLDPARRTRGRTLLGGGEMFANGGHLVPSPDGTLLAVVDGAVRIFASDDGGAIAESADRTSPSTVSAWAPDSRHFAYVRDDDGAAVSLDLTRSAARLDAAVERRRRIAALPRARDAEGHELAAGVVRRLGGGFLRHPRGVFALAWSGADRLVVSSAEAAYTWDIAARRLAGQTAAPYGEIAASRHGGRVLVASRTNPQRGTMVGVLVGPDGDVLRRFGDSAELGDVALSADGTRVAGVNLEGCVVWDADTGSVVGRLAALPEDCGGLGCVTFMDRRVLLGTGRGEIWSWDPTAGADVRPRTIFAAGESRIADLLPSPDGRAVLWVGDTTSGIVRPDEPTGTAVSLPIGRIESLAFQDADTRPHGMSWFGPDRVARVGSLAVDWFDAHTGQRMSAVVEILPRTTVAVAPDGERIATASSNGVVRVLSLTDGTTIAGPDGHTGPVTALAFSDDGTTMATAAAGEGLRLWSADTGQQLGAFDVRGVTVTALALDARAGRVAVAGAKRYPDLDISAMRTVAVGSVRVLDTVTGETTWSDHVEGTVRNVAFADGDAEVVAGRQDVGRGGWIVAGGEDDDGDSEHLRIYDARDGSARAGRDVADAHDSFGIFPSGELAIVRRGSLWSVPPTGPAHRIADLGDVAGGGAVGVRVVPGGRHVAVGPDGVGVLRIISTADGGVVASVRVERPDAPIAFSPDARHLVIAQENLQIYAVEGGERVADIELNGPGVGALAFRPRSGHLFCGQLDGTLVEWDLAPFIE